MARPPNEFDNASLLRPTPRKEKRPKMNNADTMDDLINFQLPPRRNLMAPRRSKKPVSNYGWHKERFINSAYRFIMRPSATADYTVYFADPDIYFQWTDIIQILVPRISALASLHPSSAITEGNSTCPICLSPPIAPRMTKCGHVYCFPCILHYLQTGQHSGWHKCPICFDTIGESHLKAVKWHDAGSAEDVDALQNSSDGHRGTFRMQLIQRPQITTMALPRSATWPSDLVPPHQAPFHFLPDVQSFAKFMLGTPETLKKDFEEELSMLLADRFEKMEFGDDLGSGFVDAAIERVEGQLKDVELLDTPSLQEAISSARKGMDYAIRRSEHTPFSTPVDDCPADDPLGSDLTAAHLYRDTPTPTGRIPRVKRNKVNPPPPSTSTYYFYQSASGAPIFLHPLDIRILLSHFGSYASFPDIIAVPITGRSEGTVDDELRKRCKYLAHMPAGADVVFVEADLQSVVGKEALAGFEGALRARKAKRKEKERKDERNRLKAEEKAREQVAQAESWRVNLSASREVWRRRDVEEPRDFGRMSPPPLQSQDDQTIDGGGLSTAPGAVATPVAGVWGARSFASTLSGPASARPRVAPDPKRNDEANLAFDAAWHELERAREATGNGAKQKKKGNKIVLTLNGSGAPSTAGRRR